MQPRPAGQLPSTPIEDNPWLELRCVVFTKELTGTDTGNHFDRLMVLPVRLLCVYLPVCLLIWLPTITSIHVVRMAADTWLGTRTSVDRGLDQWWW